MPISKLRKTIAPIRIEQPTLNKFFPNLPKPINHSLITKLKEVNSLSNREGYTFMKREEKLKVSIKSSITRPTVL